MNQQLKCPVCQDTMLKSYRITKNKLRSLECRSRICNITHDVYLNNNGSYQLTIYTDKEIIQLGYYNSPQKRLIFRTTSYDSDESQSSELNPNIEFNNCYQIILKLMKLKSFL